MILEGHAPPSPHLVVEGLALAAPAMPSDTAPAPVCAPSVGYPPRPPCGAPGVGPALQCEDRALERVAIGWSAGSASSFEALRRDFLAFHDRHEDMLADLIFHLSDGQVVLAHCGIVEARLPGLLSASEPLEEADPALPFMDSDRGRRAGGVRQVRLPSLAHSTLEALLRWAYGEALPCLGDPGAGSLQVAFDVLEACGRFELERLGVLLRDALLEGLSVEHFAAVLRETHLRSIPGLKHGCMRFALHHFDELIERPEVFVSPLQELPEVLSDLFRLSRCWKDGTGDSFDRFDRGGRSGSSPRPAPAPPSTFVRDFERIFAAARLEDERCRPEHEEGGHIDEEGGAPAVGCPSPGGRQDMSADCRLRVGEDVYCAHSAVLAARSDFFFATFTTDMAERALRTVTLQHVSGDASGRDSVLALLYFLYTGKTTRVTEANAMELLALVGGEIGDGSGCGGDQGFLQLHDADTLRRACEAAAERACANDSGILLEVLAQAHGLGAVRLKARVMRLAVHHFKELALEGVFSSLPPPLLSEVLRLVVVEFDGALPSAARGQRWELSLLPAPDSRLKNTYEALTSPDLSCGAGASGTAGCSEASIVASFERLVRVRRVRIGVDLTSGDFDAARLVGSKLQFQIGPGGAWQDAGVTVSEEDGMVRELELPQVVTAKAFRLVRKQRLAVGFLVFE